MGKPVLHTTTLDLHYHNPDKSKIKSALREAQAQIQRERERCRMRVFGGVDGFFFSFKVWISRAAGRWVLFLKMCGYGWVD
jgi:hypothetical protein